MPRKILTHTGTELDRAIAFSRGDSREVDKSSNNFVEIFEYSPTTHNPVRAKRYGNVDPTLNNHGGSIIEYDISDPSVKHIGAYEIAAELVTSLGTEHNVLPNITSISDNAFAGANSLQELTLPNVSYFGYQCFGSMYAAKTITVGSIGVTVTYFHANAFRSTTQSQLTVTIYTTGAYVDSILSAVRSSATGATIVLKASFDTSYNGISYNAGDIIITSSVEVA